MQMNGSVRAATFSADGMEVSIYELKFANQQLSACDRHTD